MPVSEVVIVRHAHRNTWIVDQVDRQYRSAQLNPTGIATDPALTEHGTQQSEELGVALEKLLPLGQPNHRIAIFSSPFYRCLQTIAPTVTRLRRHGWRGSVHIEAGFAEWFGTAPFENPAPLNAASMHAKFFDFVHPTYQSQSVAPRGPEPYEKLRRRVEKALHFAVLKAENDAMTEGKGSDQITLVIVCHTAPVIMLGRHLTNSWPVDTSTEDFKCFLAGISRYQRYVPAGQLCPVATEKVAVSQSEPWEVLMNSSCSHLSEGPEGGWHFRSEHVQDLRVIRGKDGHRMSTYDFMLQ